MTHRILISLGMLSLYLNTAAGAEQPADPQPLAWISVSDEGSGFVQDTGDPFIVWGVNYDHDRDGALLEDYWHDQWLTIVEDFHEIKQLGANTVRIHLQLGKFMTAEDRVDTTNLKRLSQLVKLAEQTRLYLDITGLGCYHKADVPVWYDDLPEDRRWRVQQRFWRAVAQVCHDSPAVFCYDLMNEPILPGKKTETSWLAGEFAGKHFVQRISLDLAGRQREEVAAAWVRELSTVIREVDKRHMVTVGVIPWAHVWKNAKPLFHSAEVGKPLDFVAVHFYPKKDAIAGSLDALKVYDIGKPLVVEEIFPLKCGISQTAEFIDGSRDYVDGWISFYWGQTIEECQQQTDMGSQITAEWLKHFRSQADRSRGISESNNKD